MRTLKARTVVKAHDRCIHTNIRMAHARGGVAFDENGAALSGLDHDVHIVLAIVIRGGIVVRHTRSHLFRLVRVGNALDHRRLTGSQCCRSQGESHELEKVPATCGCRGQALVAEGLIHGLVLGELLPLKVLESLRLVQVIESRPVAFVVRHIQSNQSWLLVRVSNGTWNIPNPPFLSP